MERVWGAARDPDGTAANPACKLRASRVDGALDSLPVNIALTGSELAFGQALERALLDAGHSVAALPMPAPASLESARAALAGGHLDALVLLDWDPLQKREPRDQVRQSGDSRAWLELALEAGCRNVVGVGSHLEFGAQEDRCLEDTHCRPFSAFGLGLHLTHGIGFAEADRFDARFSWARLFPLLRSETTEWALLRGVEQRLLSGSPVHLDACEERVDALLLDEAIEGLIAIVERGESEAYNICRGSSYSLRQWLTQLGAHLECPDLLHFDLPRAERLPLSTCTDAGNDRLRKLGWTPTHQEPPALAQWWPDSIPAGRALG